MENLTTLRPRLVTALLDACSSIRVKRLFLYLATKANHGWLTRVNVTSLKLGNGDRSIAKGGVYDEQFRITVPKALVDA